MAYDRYDEPRGGRRDPSGYREDRHRSDRDRYGGREREERGFFDRAGDEISSWFGDEEAERRRRRDEQMREREYGRGYEGDRDEGWFSGGRDRDRERGYGRGSDRERERGYGRDYDRDRERDGDRAWRPMDWSMSDRDYGGDHERGRRGSSGYRPMAGDYARGGEYGRGDYERRDYGRASEWGRDPYRRTSFAGSAAESNREDRPYGEWRRRHMDEIDRDYDQYRRENQERFESDFSEWRQHRDTKRGLLSQIREHMEVVGSDGEHVGTVDRIAGDRIILTKSDPESGGSHHSISCTMVDRVDDDRVVLDMDADRAKDRWRDEDRERALFEREDQGRGGPHMLDRSFSGTYR